MFAENGNLKVFVNIQLLLNGCLEILIIYAAFFNIQWMFNFCSIQTKHLNDIRERSLNVLFCLGCNGTIYFLIRHFNPAGKQEVPTVFNENKSQPDFV